MKLRRYRSQTVAVGWTSVATRTVQFSFQRGRDVSFKAREAPRQSVVLCWEQHAVRARLAPKEAGYQRGEVAY